MQASSPSATSQQGFSLVELAIVIIIIGLLTSGVLLGAQLIYQSKLNAVGRLFAEYEQGIQAFQTKFNALPGDMPNATDLIPNVTRDGDGDNLICTQDASGANVFEGILAWHHLSAAGLIDGTFADSPTGVIIPNQNAPTAPPSPTGVLVIDCGDLTFEVAATRNELLYGGIQGQSSQFNADPELLSGEDAYHIDAKYDDGFPKKGVIRGEGGSCGGVAAFANLDSSYTLNDTPSCYIGYLLAN